LLKKAETAYSFSCRLGAAFSNAILIAIEILIRINRTLIEIFLPDFGCEMLKQLTESSTMTDTQNNSR
jgi:hypothetical protein